MSYNGARWNEGKAKKKNLRETKPNGGSLIRD